MDIHILGNPHIPPLESHTICAFNQKARKLSRLLTELGHTTYFYGMVDDPSPPICTHFIQCLTMKDYANAFDVKLENLPDFNNGDYLTYNHPTLKFKQTAIVNMYNAKVGDAMLPYVSVKNKTTHHIILHLH